MAQSIKNTFDVETTLTPGGRGEFTVWVNGKTVVKKEGDDFPPEDQIISAVRQSVGQSAKQSIN
jgi:predicted Rdx family selenoprotein